MGRSAGQPAVWSSDRAFVDSHAVFFSSIGFIHPVVCTSAFTLGFLVRNFLKGIDAKYDAVGAATYGMNTPKDGFNSFHLSSSCYVVDFRNCFNFPKSCVEMQRFRHVVFRDFVQHVETQCLLVP